MLRRINSFCVQRRQYAILVASTRSHAGSYVGVYVDMSLHATVSEESFVVASAIAHPFTQGHPCHLLKGSDGAAAGPPGARRVMRGHGGPMGTP